jgi:hypothetical protein
MVSPASSGAQINCSPAHQPFDATEITILSWMVSPASRGGAKIAAARINHLMWWKSLTVSPAFSGDKMFFFLVFYD